MENKFIIHLITQDDQPFGSVRKCCERCGKGKSAMNPEKEGYVTDLKSYTKENAKEYNSILCINMKDT